MHVHEDWLLTPERTAVHVPTATAILADLHLGYSEARRRSGEAVPCGLLDALLAPLGRALALHDIRRLVIAGDLFEAGCCDALVAGLLLWVRRVGVELAGVVPGNHDRGLTPETCPLPLFPQGLVVGGWHVVHGDGALPAGKVIHGHVHPCVRLSDRVAAPCYVISPERLILPAFSADARGADVLGMREWQRHRCCIPVGDAVLDFGEIRGLRRARPGVSRNARPRPARGYQ